MHFTLPPSPTVGTPVVAGAFGDHTACPCKPPGRLDIPGLARCFLGGPMWDLSPRCSSLLESATAACLAGQQGRLCQSRVGFSDFSVDLFGFSLCWHW